MVILFVPFLLLWLFYWLTTNRWSNVKLVLLSGLLGLGLASFFLLPAFFEKNLVQTESLLRFELDFRANYLKVSQLFLDRIWGYGTSIPGPEGGMNFQVGWPHWWLVVVSALLLFVSKIRKSSKALVFGIIGAFIFSVFMTHNKSTFIWINISLLKYFQFPYVFVSFDYYRLFTGRICGISSKEKWQIYVGCVIIVLSIILN